MKRGIQRSLLCSAFAIIAGSLVMAREASAQDAPQADPGTEAAAQDPTSQRMVADGRRGKVPLETYAVAPGTKFLVRLEDDLSTKDLRENSRFKVKTLEPLEAGNGIYLPAGAEILGHVSRVESAGMAGRASIWLTFDDIHTKFGKLPIVADVVAVPGDHSVRTGTLNRPGREGVIEGRTSTQQDAASAAAAGAMLGAVQGVKDKDKKEAAEGAMAAAVAAYLMESGRGRELNLPKGTKLELELGRSLYLVKE
jgi:hypothetical protein